MTPQMFFSGIIILENTKSTVNHFLSTLLIEMKSLAKRIFIALIFLCAACTRSIPTETVIVGFPDFFSISTPSPTIEEFGETEKPTIKPYTPREPPISDSTIQSIATYASVAEIGYMGEDLLIITVEIDSKLGNEFIASLNGIDYECITQEDIPDFIYCFGPRPETGHIGEFVLKLAGNEIPLLDEEILIPESYPPHSTETDQN